MRLILFIALFIAWFSTSAQQGWHVEGLITLRGAELKPIGRTSVDDSGRLELISTAAHFRFRYTGMICAVFARVPNDSASGYLQVEVDGKYRMRVRVTAKVDSPILIVSRYEGIHELTIYKTTEASSGPVYIDKINGIAAQALPVPAKPVIEFIGNSITSGAASDSSSFPCGLGNYHEHTNGYMAYGPRVARLLGAEYVVNSVSGIGIYRTWNLDSPSMPLVYGKLRLRTDDTASWSSDAYQPAIVSIALGTNDLSAGDKIHPRPAFDSAVFVDRYITFVETVKARYPKAQIVLLGSPMIKGDRDKVLRACLAAVKKEIDRRYISGRQVACFYFKPMTPHGCIGHPSVSDHAELAAELKPFLQDLLRPGTTR